MAWGYTSIHYTREGLRGEGERDGVLWKSGEWKRQASSNPTQPLLLGMFWLWKCMSWVGACVEAGCCTSPSKAACSCSLSWVGRVGWRWSEVIYTVYISLV
jgi:hypothetical protein